jgi:hypothetical protein
MELGDALKKTAKKSKKVKSVRPRATVAHKDRPYTNDMTRKKTTTAKKAGRPSAIVGGLLQSFAEDTVRGAKDRVVNAYHSRLEEPLKRIAKLVKGLRK